MPKTCTTCGTPLENGYWCPQCDARALDTILASICNTAECQKKTPCPGKGRPEIRITIRARTIIVK